MPVGVNAAVKAVKPAIAHPVPDAAVPEAAGLELLASHDSPLPPRKLSQSGWGVFPGHMPR